MTDAGTPFPATIEPFLRAVSSPGFVTEVHHINEDAEDAGVVYAEVCQHPAHHSRTH